MALEQRPGSIDRSELLFMKMKRQNDQRRGATQPKEERWESILTFLAQVSTRKYGFSFACLA
jgi:hypothetical protein